MIIIKDKHFVLHTNSTTYAFHVLDTGHIEHLYYGKKIRFGDNLEGIEALKEQHAFAPGNTINYDQQHQYFTLEDECLEMSSYGHGDYREPFISIVHADGGRTSDFLYENFLLREGKSVSKLPVSYAGDEKVEEVSIILKDKNYNLQLLLRYCVFEKEDIITRTAVLTNESDETVAVERLMSFQLDMPDAGYTMSTFNGAWIKEMSKKDTEVNAGKIVGGSVTGTSSNKANPFFMLSRKGVTQQQGEVYGFNLVYSGNHYEAVEVSSFGKTRIVQGIQPEGFRYMLGAGETLEAPEAVLSFSDRGYNGLSQNMHSFIRDHIVRGTWAHKNRPVLLNSWEAAYFDINESKLLALAGKAAKAGIELFVMDDGWFGTRDDDSQALGDWDVNLKKLPGGLSGLCDKINKLGLMFGLWVEPEMVNVNSRLFGEHPDWCLMIPGVNHSEGRNQRVLDLTRVEVQDYLIEAMSKVFSSANITYVKWDMNRHISDYYSSALSADNQGEVAYRYVCGLYRVLGELMKRFPDILFEGCSSGGNRFDLGMLCFFPQIWGSDNSDAICRTYIQTGYSYGYPLETVGAHVSECPNHQTLRNTPLDTRFAIASFGSFGYECNLSDMTKEEFESVKAQVALYKEWRETMQFGAFYRGRTFDEGNICEWTVVGKNQSTAVGMIVQKLAEPNKQFEYYKADGLDGNKMYHLTNRELKYNIKGFGNLINAVAPIHVKKDSIVHNVIARVVKMDGESEDITAYGDVLMNAGVKLKQAFSGTGYNDQVRFFPDFSSRLYFMKTID